MVVPALLITLSTCLYYPPTKLDASQDEVEPGALPVSRETMHEIIRSIASPPEMPSPVHLFNIPFLPSCLATPDNPSPPLSSPTEMDMSYKLGALFANLEYLIQYEEPEVTASCFSGISELADSLQIGQYFNHMVINRILFNNPSPDSLILISVNSFYMMEHSLRQSGRGILGALMITGTWLERLYLTTQAAEAIREVEVGEAAQSIQPTTVTREARENAREALHAMIAGQKLILTDILLVLNTFKDDQVIQDYITDLEILKSIYDDVKIIYEVDNPRTIERDGTLSVVQSESSQVIMTDAILRKLTRVTAQIRNMHLD